MKNVLITGAMRGIGLSVLQTLHDEGYAITAIYNVSEESATLVLKQFPNVEGYKVDLSKRNEIESFVKKLADKALYAIINVAGVAMDDSVANFDMDKWDKTIAINLTAPVLFSTKLRSNLEEGGAIVNVASIFGAVYGMNMSLSYGASKAALINSTKSLSYQLRQKKVRVNAIAPSIVDTDMTSLDTKEMLDEVSRRSGIGRIAQPEEIASIVSFLISKKASYINGQTIIADGGYSAWDGIY